MDYQSNKEKYDQSIQLIHYSSLSPFDKEKQIHQAKYNFMYNKSTFYTQTKQIDSSQTTRKLPLLKIQPQRKTFVEYPKGTKSYF
jgi:hypothetical protein